MIAHDTRSCRPWWVPVMLAVALPGPQVGSGAEPAAAPKAVDYMILVTGGELLEGAYADGHTHFLTRTLRPLGLQCVGSLTVNDRPADLKDALRFARNKARLVIVTGGLGPTDNDVTRETLAEFTGIALQEQPEVLADMERRFNTPRDKLRRNLRRQTQVPTRGSYLKNANGTAVGLVFELDEAVIVALPGPPRELQPMARDELVPYLSGRFGTRLSGCALTLRFVGLGQSQIDHTLKEHITLPRDITTASQFEGGRVDFTFSLPEDTPSNRVRLEDLRQVVRKHLGDNLYAEDETTLEEHVAGLLQARGATLVLAEVGSNGSLAAALDGTQHAPRVLTGAYVGPTDDNVRRLLRVPDGRWNGAASSAERATVLATAAAELAGSTWAVAVGEPQQGQGGARYVDVVFRQSTGRVDQQRMGLRGSGDSARAGLTTQLLDQLRRRLR